MSDKSLHPPGEQPAVRPETQALDALIRATIARVQQSQADKPTDAMLFLGNSHQAYPTLLVQDPVLEPVDKIVWLVILQSARASGAPTAFPSYAYLAGKANIASTSTIARVIAILRATRWLSLCGRVRDPGGRFRGNVYALHDEPLPLVDTLHLDPGYMTFLAQAKRHGHARVRKVARGVLDTIDADVEAGIEVNDRPVPLERRIEARHAAMGKPAQRYFSFSAETLQRMRGTDSTPDHQDQNSKLEPDRLRNLCPQKSKSVGCSSSYINKTTTTTDQDHKQMDEKFPLSSDLIFPERLSAAQYDLAMSYLSEISPEQHQAVLDEMAGRMLAVTHGMSPLYDEMSYLGSLCNHVRNGTFVKNLGLKVAERRQREQTAGHRAPQSSQRRTRTSGDEPWENRKVKAAAGIAQMRKALGGAAELDGPEKTPEKKITENPSGMRHSTSK